MPSNDESIRMRTTAKRELADIMSRYIYNLEERNKYADSVMRHTFTLLNIYMPYDNPIKRLYRFAIQTPWGHIMINKDSSRLCYMLKQTTNKLGKVTFKLCDSFDELLEGLQKSKIRQLM